MIIPCQGACFCTGACKRTPEEQRVYEQQANAYQEQLAGLERCDYCGKYHPVYRLDLGGFVIKSCPEVPKDWRVTLALLALAEPPIPTEDEQ